LNKECVFKLFLTSTFRWCDIIEYIRTSCSIES